MIPTNFYMYFVAALIPMIIGATYYHPKVLGTAWMKSNGFTMESLEGANMSVIMGTAYLLSFVLAFGMTGSVVHQVNVGSLFMPEVMEPGSAIQQELSDFMTKYGDRHRTVTHGLVHGFINALFFALPLIGINAAFERRGWKYVLIHFGYWAITLMLMGGLLSATLEFGGL
ncbi:MAG: DUF1761 domain-containing protein [Lewinella sp.]|uniref:DUF1761 domain-containing protein n=1 Tax=Lewinella sp. TaxID=2004506 RepID=UPI003D6B5B9B